MSRSRTLNYHCPKCKAKKMSRRVWRSGGYSFWKCFNRSCNLIIDHPDRDAEIEDYYSPLDKMSRLNDDERITDYLMIKRRDVYQKGLEVLFVGENLFLVRYKTKDVSGRVGLFWRAVTIDEGDEGRLNPKSDVHLFRQDAVPKDECQFRNQYVGNLIGDYYEKDTHLWTAGASGVFKGRWSKSLKAQIIEWATDFDTAVVGLVENARSRVKAWNDANNDLIEYVKGTEISINSFNFFDEKVAKVNLNPLSLKKCRKLDKVLPHPLRIDLIVNEKELNYYTTEQAEQVVELLGIDNFKANARVKGRLTVNQIKQAADAIRKKPMDELKKGA